MSGDGRGATSGAGGDRGNGNGNGNGSGEGQERGGRVSGWKCGGASGSPLRAAGECRGRVRATLLVVVTAVGYPVRPVTRPASIVAARTDTSATAPAPAPGAPRSLPARSLNGLHDPQLRQERPHPKCLVHR